MPEKSRYLATLITAFGLSSATGYLNAEFSSLSRISACIEQDLMNVPIITYNSDHACDDIHRGRKLRLDRNYSGSLCLSHIASPDGIDPEIFRKDFLMFKQIGPTCSLTGLAAILSDISLRYGGAAIDPYVLSDIVDSGPFMLSTLSDELQDVDDLNIQALQLNKLDGAVPFNTHVRFEMMGIDMSQVPPDRFQLKELIGSILADPDAYIMLSSLVSYTKNEKKAYHAVVVVGSGIDTLTKEPYLLVAEPNGGQFLGDKNFSAVQQDWEPVLPGKFTTVIRLNDTTMDLFREITVIKSYQPEDTSK